MNKRALLRCGMVAVGMVLGAARLMAAEAGVEFTGFFRDDQGLTFALREKASGNSKLLVAGQEFAGYAIRRFDDKEGVLIVAREQVEYRLPLVVSKIKQVDSPPGPPPEVKKKILNNLRQLDAASAQYYLEHGVDKVTYDELVGAGKYVKQIEPADGEDYSKIQFYAQSRKLEVTTQQGFVISYDR